MSSLGDGGWRSCSLHGWSPLQMQQHGGEICLPASPKRVFLEEQALTRTCSPRLTLSILLFTSLSPLDTPKMFKYTPMYSIYRILAHAHVCTL